MGTEYELKYAASPEVLAALAREYGENGQEFIMETTYYDTPSGAFSRRHYTFRRRMENGRAVCTLKTPADGGARGEWELPCDRIEDAAEGLCALGAPAVLMELVKEGVAPVCGAAFRRLAVPVQWGGSVLELALDQGKLTGGGREMPLCEVEVELKTGSRRDAQQLAQLIAYRYGLKQEPRSKHFRAKSLRQGDQNV